MFLIKLNLMLIALIFLINLNLVVNYLLLIYKMFVFISSINS